MARKSDIHVTPRDNGWAVIRENAARAGKVTRTQKEAIDIAKEMAKRDRVEAVIHRKDGRIRDSDSYGNDPCPPRDRVR